MSALFLTLFVVFCLFIVSTCNGLLFNVSRGAHVGSQDLFSNLDPSAKCPNRQLHPDAGRSWCLARKGNCSTQGCCMCKCQYSSATFQMKADPNLGTCVENNYIRSFAGCRTMFASETKSQPLVTLALSNIGSKRISFLPSGTGVCSVKSAEYLNITWKQLHKKDIDTFIINRTRFLALYKYELEWTGAINSSYSGYIMKVNWECRSGGPVQSGCVVFKTKGTISRSFASSTSKVSSTRVISTTQVTASPKVNSTVRLKSPIVTPTVTSTTQERLSTIASRASLTAPLNLTAESITSVAKATFNTETTTATSSMTSQQTPYSTNHDVTKSPAIKTETLATEPTARNTATSKPVTHNSGESKDKSSDKNRCSCKEEERNRLMIAIGVGAAAGICVFVVLLCLKMYMWRIIGRRRKYRNEASYCTRTKGIANPTYASGSQNHLPITGTLKNSVYEDAVYTELEERVRKSAVMLLGNQPYETFDDLLLRNPGAIDSLRIALNNIQPKPGNAGGTNMRKKENTDCSTFIRSNHRGNLGGEKSVYQSLVIENPYDCVEKRSDHIERADEVETVYQGLVKAKEVTGSLKLDLKRNTYQGLNRESLVYQSLTNQCPNYTAPSPADVDESPKITDDVDSNEPEEISRAETSISTSEDGPACSAPLDDVLEGPSCGYSSTPLYAVLEGPDPSSGCHTNLGFEPPVYAVLEGPETS